MLEAHPTTRLHSYVHYVAFRALLCPFDSPIAGILPIPILQHIISHIYLLVLYPPFCAINDSCYNGNQHKGVDLHLGGNNADR